MTREPADRHPVRPIPVRAEGLDPLPDQAMNDHVAAALLGTARREPPAAPPGVRAIDEHPAERLLGQAAVLTVRARAGIPPGAAEPIAPAPPETAPVAPAAAARRLEQILGGEHPRLLPEWLTVAARAGYRVPPRLLPALLGRGRSDRALRPHIAATAGRRGMWLAMQNPDWAYLVMEGGPAWETGARGQRLAYLTRLRAEDPAGARRTLEGTWAAEPAADRAAFLGVLGGRLSAGDEGFLEAALDDRAREVRQGAADLLARLPGSAYAGRMAARAAACVRLEGRRLRAEPPEDWDDALRRDLPRPIRPDRSGLRAALLREILSRAPLPMWAGRLGMPPAEAVRRARADDYARDLHEGWARAAAWQADPAWARALLAHAALEPEPAAALLPALPEPDRGTAAAGMIAATDDGQRLMSLFEHLPGPWNGDLAEAALATFARREARDPRSWVLSHLCRLAAERLAPHAAPRVEVLAREHDSWPLAELAAILRFRHDMVTELDDGQPRSSARTDERRERQA